MHQLRACVQVCLCASSLRMRCLGRQHGQAMVAWEYGTAKVRLCLPRGHQSGMANVLSSSTTAAGTACRVSFAHQLCGVCTVWL